MTLFQTFWDEWPSGPRKVAKRQCEAKWQKRKLDAIADKILRAVRHLKTTEDWRKGFVPMPATFLNQDRWEAIEEVQEAPKQTSDVERTQAYLREQSKPLTPEQRQASTQAMRAALARLGKTV